MNKSALYSSPNRSSTAFVLRYSPLVKRIAHHLLSRLPPNVQLDDLIQSGIIGLLEAEQNYDATKGASFETFAGIRIRGAMLDDIRRGDWVPRSVYKNHRDITKAITELERQLTRPPQDIEIAEHLSMSLSDYHRVLNDINCGRLMGIADLGVAEDTLTCNNSESHDLPLSEVVDCHFQTALAAAIKTLPEREALALSLYYNDELNLKEIGLVLGVSESRISQIHSQAMLRLRAKLKAWNA